MSSSQNFSSRRKAKGMALMAGLGLLGAALLASVPDKQETHTVIIQGADLETIKSTVLALGGTITHELGIINAVGARLSPAQRQALGRSQGISRLYEDRGVSTAWSSSKPFSKPSSKSFSTTTAENTNAEAVTEASDTSDPSSWELNLDTHYPTLH